MTNNFSHKTNLIFEPLNIEFDKNFNPKEKNEDYLLLREIFTDPETMKTSTFFACGIPLNDTDLHLAMISGIEVETEYQEDYGLKKVFNKKTGKYMGVAGFIRRKEYAKDSFIVEGLIFLKSEYIGSGMGFWIEKIFFEKLDELNAILIASAWEENRTAIRLMKKNGMNYKGSFIKIYNNNAIKVGMFMKFPSNIIALNNLLNIEEFFTCNKISSLRSVQNI